MIVPTFPEELSDMQIRCKKPHNIYRPQKQTIDDLSEENPCREKAK
jgi:hypothetical protein